MMGRGVLPFAPQSWRGGCITLCLLRIERAFRNLLRRGFFMSSFPHAHAASDPVTTGANNSCGVERPRS
jgi:hypothetical protein